ncbi:PAS domain S-box protein [Pseudothauera nasutitermitis]|nr:PAS domain S-box protein [Pseudothauera nasutitermitis]
MSPPLTEHGQAQSTGFAPRFRGLLIYVATAIVWTMLSTPLAPLVSPSVGEGVFQLWGFVLLAPLALYLGGCLGPRRIGIPGIDLQSLRQQEARYLTLLESLPVGIFHYDRKLRITEFNGRFAEILHVPMNTLRRLDIGTLRDQRILEPLRAALDGKPARYDGEYLGTYTMRKIRVTLRTAPVFDEEGQVSGGVGIVEDVSAQYEAESMLRESETRYALAMRGTHEGLWDWNPESHSLFLSNRLLLVLGIEGDHLRTTSDEWLKLIHPDDRKLFQNMLIDHLKGRTPHFECEYRVRHQGGDYRWVLARGLALRNERGLAYRMVGSIGDITGRKRAEVRLKNELAFTRTLIDSLPIALLVVRPDGSISLWNRFFAQILGYSDDDINGMLALRLVAPEDKALLEQRLEATLHDGEASVRAALIARDGRRIPFDFFARIIELDGERRVLCIASDISERLATEARMRELNRTLESRVAERTAQLASALKELESFSYSVSHDLRAPLRAIDGYSVILTSEYGSALDDEARMLLQRMRAAVQRMGMLIDDLLNLARVSRQPLERQTVRLNPLIEEIVAELRQREPERRVRIEVAPDLQVRADPNLMRIALENLLGNAWKFTARHEDALIRVTQTHDPEGQEVFCVEDNGAGFDMRYVDKLFGAFQRLHHERDFQGTGIGLATVARIVQRHGGEIWAHGEPDQGARFCFTLGSPLSDGGTTAADHPAA